MRPTTERTRAIDDSEKAARRDTLLNAAKTLFLEQQPSLPSVQAIASRAGLAKGTVYLYFSSKEEIFISLLGHMYEDLLEQMNEVAEKASDPVEEMVESIVAYTQENPHFLPLASMASTVLEQNISDQHLMAFKAMLFSGTIRLGQSISQTVGGQTDAEACAVLLVHTHAHMLGLWQMQQMPPRIREALSRNNMGLLAPEFNQALRTGLKALWGGTPSPP